MTSHRCSELSSVASTLSRKLRERIAALEGHLAVARQAARRTEESVTWQLFQKARARLYRAIGGERSLMARALARSLRLAGRYLGERSPAEPPSSPGPRIPSIELPEYGDPQVSLIIPVHSQAALTEACLYSIADHTTHARYEVILVDDTADADTKRMLAGVKGATILRNESNLGFLRSMNRGASVARGDWFVLFNNDTEVTRGWLSAMLECATSAPDVGVVTPKFIYPDGTLNEAGGVVWRDGTAMNFGRCDLPSYFQYEYRRETDYGSAAALMVSAKLWKDVGGFDERYVPIYYEDTDLCFQARQRGLRVLYEPEAVVVHVEGATSGTNPTSGAKRYQELNRQKFVEQVVGAARRTVAVLADECAPRGKPISRPASACDGSSGAHVRPGLRVVAHVEHNAIAHQARRQHYFCTREPRPNKALYAHASAHGHRGALWWC